MQNMLAYAAIGTVFDMPVVMTTSAETGLSLRPSLFITSNMR